MKIQTITWEEALPIRHKVLWPSKPFLFCKVDGDEDAHHYGGFINDRLVCVASIYIEGNTARLRKFATIDDFQGRGFGTKLITHIIKTLKEIGVKYFWCDARSSAIHFYHKFAMSQQGNEFDKSGILYVKMKVELL